VSVNLDDLTKSLDKTGGVERIMDYLFFQMTAINGFDSIGHYLRAGLIVNLCSTYATAETAGCPANFTTGSSASASVKPQLAAAPKKKGKGAAGSVPPQGNVLGALLGNENPAAARQRSRNIAQIRRQAAQPSPGLKNPRDQMMLDYLLGPGK
jgi:hypothetical protein